jgi:hypothetical protein
MRILIGAGDALSDTTLPPGVDSLLRSATDIRVLSPTLVGRVQWLTGDIDHGRRVADDRLIEVLGSLCERGIHATGGRGDELPRTAFADAVRRFGPDHILLGLSGREHATWQRHNLVDHLINDHRLPVTAFVLSTSQD